MKLSLIVRDIAVVSGSFLLGFALLGTVLYGKWRSAPHPRQVSEWPAVAEGAHRVGSADAPITIAEFSDFQCPFCRAEAATLAEVFNDYDGEVAVVFRHFPILSVHPFAERAALAAECAGDQGRFFPYHTVLFENQDSIGTTPWSTLALRAGVPDTSRFNRCLTDQAALSRVQADVALGQRLEIRGTPTVIINGYELPGTPSRATIDSAIKALQREARQVSTR